MNVAMILYLMIIVGLISFIIFNRKKLFSEESYSFKSGKEQRKLDAELKVKESITNKINLFLQSSEKLEPIALWRNENIYKYIGNKECVYKFVDILPLSETRLGIDDKFLCFKQMVYERVEDTKDFMESLNKKL